MAKNLLMLNLTKDIKKSAYKLDGIYYENTFYLDLYLKKYSINKIICYGTKESDWEYLYKALCRYFYNTEEETIIKEVLLEFDEDEAIEYVKDEFFRKFNDKVEIYNIEKNTSSKEILTYTYSLKERLEEFSNIYFDITGGKRHISIIIFKILTTLINNIKDESKKEISFEVLYSKLSENEKYYECINLTDIPYRINYINHFSKLFKYGNPEDVLDYLIDETLGINLINLYYYTQIKISKNIKSIIDEIKKNINNYNYSKHPIQKILIENYINNLNESFDGSAEKAYIYNLNLKNYYLAIINFAEIESKFDEEIKEKLKKIRNFLVHPKNISQNKANLKNYNEIYEEIMTFFENERQKNREKKLRALVFNVGANYDKCLTKFEKKEDETKFPFKLLLSDKYDKIIVFGQTNTDWNNFFSEYLAEINEKNVEIKDLKNLERQILTQEVSNVFKQIDKRFEVILLDDSLNYVQRDEYFYEIFNFIEKKLMNNKKYYIDYNITNGYRDVSLMNYVNLCIFELFSNFEIRNIFYSDYDKNTNSVNIIKSNEIIEAMKLSEKINEFSKYNKYEDINFLSKELKNLMKEFNQNYMINNYSILFKKDIYDSVNEYNPKDAIEKNIKEIMLCNLKELYLKETHNEKLKTFILQQIRFKNYALAILLIDDYFFYSVIEEDKYHKNKKNHKKFLNQEIKNENFQKYKAFYNKYIKIFEIRNDVAHLNEKFRSYKSIKHLNENCLSELFSIKMDEVKKIYESQKNNADILT